MSKLKHGVHSPLMAEVDKSIDIKKVTNAMKEWLKTSLELNQVTQEQHDMIAACLTAQGKGAPVSVTNQHLDIVGVGQQTQWTVVFNPIGKEHKDHFKMMSQM